MLSLLITLLTLSFSLINSSPISHQPAPARPLPTTKFTLDNLWPQGIVPYHVDDRYFTKKERTLITTVISAIEAVSCIRFQFIDDIRTRNETYLFLTTGLYC